MILIVMLSDFGGQNFHWVGIGEFPMQPNSAGIFSEIGLCKYFVDDAVFFNFVSDMIKLCNVSEYSVVIVYCVCQ